MDATRVKEAARKFGADLVGITALDNFAGTPPEHDPRNIFKQGKSMIVIGRRIPRGALRGVENGTTSAQNGVFEDFGMEMLEDQFLAKATYDLVIWMESAGFEAVPMFGYDAEAAVKYPVGSPVAPGKAARQNDNRRCRTSFQHYFRSFPCLLYLDIRYAHAAGCRRSAGIQSPYSGRRQSGI